MTRQTEIARSILDAQSYVVLATSDAAGAPWATPVWFATESYTTLYWVSFPGARHSSNIASRPEISAVVFDGSVAPGEGQAVYLAMTARIVTDVSEVEHGLAVLSAKLVGQGGTAFDVERVTGSARLRLYRATVGEAWILDPDRPFDERTPVSLPG